VDSSREQVTRGVTVQRLPSVSRQNAGVERVTSEGEWFQLLMLARRWHFIDFEAAVPKVQISSSGPQTEVDLQHGGVLWVGLSAPIVVMHDGAECW
jgi:hypothetical protein